MSFLPEGTSIPQKNEGYFKFELGENKFRILGSAITGFKLWVEGKPQRRKTNQFSADELANADINKFTGKKKTPEYFWAFPVYNYKAEKIQILEVNQVTIMRGIESYLNDEDYGKDPKQYDLVITQYEGTSGKIEYSVKAKPPKVLDEGVMQLYQDMSINLNALYTGGDPFAGEEIDNDAIAKAIDESRVN